jgi:hypothetical protein
MAIVEFKVKVWERIHVPNWMVEKVKEGIENGSIKNTSDLYELEDSTIFDSEILLETSEQLSKTENDEHPTIELINKGTVVATN